MESIHYNKINFIGIFIEIYSISYTQYALYLESIIFSSINGAILEKDTRVIYICLWDIRKSNKMNNSFNKFKFESFQFLKESRNTFVRDSKQLLIIFGEFYWRNSYRFYKAFNFCFHGVYSFRKLINSVGRPYSINLYSASSNVIELYTTYISN